MTAVDVSTDKYGFDEISGISGQLNRSEAVAALEILKSACEPAVATAAIQELTKLRYKTKIRAEDAADTKFMLMAYAEELSEFPLDAIRYGCQQAARTETFFPAVAVLREKCQFAMRQRNRLKADLAKAMRSGGIQPS